MAVVPFWERLSAETTLVPSRGDPAASLASRSLSTRYALARRIPESSEVNLPRFVPPLSPNAIVFCRAHSVRSRRMNFVCLVPLQVTQARL